MGNIVLLDDLTINKIAAGEVIERPASVVKELVENSIDAGADNIKIEIRNGGITSIRITDNGKGIMADDLEIAFERHATSKIRKAEDLSEVTSMGFRGEALASIASIAKVTVTTKTKDSDTGYKVVVEGGNMLEKTETGCPQGTTMLVENLFFNTPVRYKFLKKDFTEAGYVEDVVARIALVNPGIAIKFVNSGKTIIQTSGDGDIKNVIYNIYGRDVAENLIRVNYKFENTEITGVIGKPAIARSNRANQLFFVNKRFVKDKTLTSAAEQAYKGMLTIGKYGFLVLNLTVDPHKVDVNVHPAKLEVRFEEENIIFKSVYHAIKDNLLSNDLVPGEKKEEDNSRKFEKEVKPAKKENQGGWLFGRNKNEFGQGNNVIEQIYTDKNLNNRPKYSWDNSNDTVAAKPVNQIINPTFNENAIGKVENITSEMNSQTSSVLEESLKKLREIQQSMRDAGYKPTENVDELIKENNIEVDTNGSNSEDDSQVGNDGNSYKPFMINEKENNNLNVNSDNEPKTMNQILQMIEEEKNSLNNANKINANDDSEKNTDSKEDSDNDLNNDSNVEDNGFVDLNSKVSVDESEVDDLVKAKLAELEMLNQTIQDLKKKVELEDLESKDFQGQDSQDKTLTFEEEKAQLLKDLNDNNDDLLDEENSNDVENQKVLNKQDEVEDAFDRVVNSEAVEEDESKEEEKNLEEIADVFKKGNELDRASDELDESKLSSEELLEEIRKSSEENIVNEEETENPANFEDMYEKMFGKPVYTKAEGEGIQNVDEEDKLDDLKTAENMSLFTNIPEKINQKYKFIGIAFSTYIIIEMDGEIFIIDQHAAHERIMYEKVKANYYSSSTKNSQLMLLPDIITLTHKEMGIVKDNLEIFEKAGFQLKEFGENTIRLDGVPEVCIDLDTKELFLETLDEINTVARTAKQEIEEKFIATVACKAAVKANMALTREEVDALMEELLKLPNPFTCPHGRPTAIRMSKIDIEKKFSRR